MQKDEENNAILNQNKLISQIVEICNNHEEGKEIIVIINSVPYNINKKNGKTVIECIMKPRIIKTYNKSKVEFTEELVNKIKEYKEQGLSSIAIEKITGVNNDRVLEIIHGKDKINGRYKKSTSALNPEVIEQIKQLLQSNSTKAAIEQKTGVSRYYINKIQKGESVPTDGKLKIDRMKA